ncbi:hypothetical protein SAMN04489740_3225 [Arthrobacter alpinus]|uniref:Transposase IS30-like HTH domain-containing protein n=1 Tax=Arthrobacter alpinus TaxID=656366 RepID=A0A1H5MXW2_9MICC|nr:hypothetical protein SAMN04489740_3225 [Arthrobacter alpinus]
MGNSEDCRIVGISRSSGTRCRYGHRVISTSGIIKKYPRISGHRPAVDSAQFLSEDDRAANTDILHARFGIRAVAREPGLSPSTVSRKIRGTYMSLPANAAQRSAGRRRCSQHAGKIVGNSSLQGLVRDHLNQRWSSRQIGKRLHADYPSGHEVKLVPETIYQSLYGRRSLDLANGPVLLLRTGRTGRQPRRHTGHRMKRFPAMIMIKDRTAEVASRLLPGLHPAHFDSCLFLRPRQLLATSLERDPNGLRSRQSILLFNHHRQPSAW